MPSITSPREQKPLADPTRIVVCADDYGFTPGVSRGIRELIAARRISATSVMSGSEFWPFEAAALKAIANDADIGLHVTLTDQKPLGDMPLFAPEGRFPPLPAVFRAGLLRRLPLLEIEAEIERQVEAFVAHYGAPPAHIDGHHHMHQLPGVRDIVVRIAARIGNGRTWVRSCAERHALIARRGIAPLKTAIIGALGPGIARRARNAEVPINNGFSGAYDFAHEKRPLDDLFARFGRTGFIETDAQQSIGKRYARMDEAGCPFCFTIDGDTLKDRTVTIRDRDTGGQQRIGLDGVAAFLGDKLGV